MAEIQRNFRRKNQWQLPISKHINVNYRDYALYVLENRGIPSFYDGLTNVQRLIALSAPTSFDKTPSLIGTCFKEGYHHGDKSLIGAINKMARPFNCADEILIGDGFFGSPIDNSAAAPRYTSIKINSTFKNIIKENSFLNTRNDEDRWDPLWVDLPIGLVTSIVGIAVGYKTTVLPRNLDDIRNYFAGKTKEVKPYFKNFTGTVERFEKLNKTWVISGDFDIDNDKKIIQIKDLPPIVKFGSFLKKLYRIFEKFENKAKIENNSATHADLKITFRGHGNEWKMFKDLILKAIKIIVTEAPIFIKDGLVLEYEKIEDYLDDFKYRIAELAVNRIKHFLKLKEREISFNEAKIKFLEFMLVKKRTEKEIDAFLLKFPKDTSNKLNGILLRHLSDDELKRLKSNIKNFATDKVKLEKELKKKQTALNKLTDTTKSRGIANKASSIDLFMNESIDEIDGIEVFGVKEEKEEKEDELINDDNITN